MGERDQDFGACTKSSESDLSLQFARNLKYSTATLSSPSISCSSFRRNIHKRPAPSPPSSLDLGEIDPCKCCASYPTSSIVSDMASSNNSLGSDGWNLVNKSEENVPSSDHADESQPVVKTQESQILPNESLACPNVHACHFSGACHGYPLSPVYHNVHAVQHPTKYGPMFLSSALPCETHKLEPIPESSSLGAKVEFIPVAPLTFVSQSHSLALATSHLACNSSCFQSSVTQHSTTNPTSLLSHSSSDPSLFQSRRCTALPHQFSLPDDYPLGSLNEETAMKDGDLERAFHDNVNQLDLFPSILSGDTLTIRSETFSSPDMYDGVITSSSRFSVRVTFTNLTMAVIGIALMLPKSASLLHDLFRYYIISNEFCLLVLCCFEPPYLDVL